ncbi:amidase [Blastococcus xanthinilyticus]|uniref:Amidase/aspartyl-tRNA(Asn)/glutamyl-tRNA(Gln) amidotransferase subunit A n=1 Tax=Blastococcus xanthinilyticus TaxID=1564164 RepID=A0A5S5D2G1_9ACTN|nr:amidase family protein [Blastococcus xanthinilyticus]TYP89594.1 amidase/aspartyl-tRNA(Asn)/glutamyl-tRNA(Gln) amidotransferase subunit A [Blastococcus xanthinilyticus]
MSDTELWARPATELAELIREKSVSPVEILDSVLDRLDAVEPTVHAFITVTDDLARAEAAAAAERARRGELIGPMDGIPYSIKDLENTAGIRTTLGSMFFTDNVPDTDSVVAGRLRSSGGVLLGKTNTPHFGYKDMADNLVAETTVNPWDPTRTVGGSSGGAAAAVAAGLGPLAQGSDGAGSIRIPAALCGVVGFKPSFGRIPVHPGREYWSHRTHNGPLTRTVADAALMTAVMAGDDDRDALSLTSELGEFLPPPPSAHPLAGRKVRWSPDLGYGLVSAEVARVVAGAVQGLAELGCEVEEKVPGWEDPSSFHRVIYTSQIAAGIGPLADRHPEWIEDTLMQLISVGRSFSAVELKTAEIQRGALYNAARSLFEEIDFLVTPAMPLVAWPAEPGPGLREIDGTPLPPHMGRSYAVNPFNLTGQPAITVPCGWTEAGLPVGVQIVGRRNSDIDVLEFAHVLEQHLALTDRWPALP